MTFSLEIKTATEIAAQEIAVRRSGASLSRREFCLALAQREIISDADCIAAAKGEWPSSLTGFLGLLTPTQRRDVEIEWAAASRIDRMDTNILILASWLNLTDAATDALFGIAS